MVKVARKRRGKGLSPQILLRCFGMAGTVMGLMIILVTSIQQIGSLIDENDLILSEDNNNVNNNVDDNVKSKSSEKVSSSLRVPASVPAVTVSHQTPLAYGTKGLKERTAELVQEAISTGFRHIVTCGHHVNHNETGAGIGWKASNIPREEIFLQTCFLPFASKEFSKEAFDMQQEQQHQTIPETIEEQVRASIQSSLINLQTTYIDAVLFHNFRATLWDTDQIHKAWKVLEDFVEKGVIRKLGIVSIHSAEWFEEFYDKTNIKPSIVQNRFHSNRQYDIPMQEIFQKHDIWVQRFWLLNGSSRQGKNNQKMAQQKNVTTAQLLLAFVMSMGRQTCLVGTKSVQHMKDDVDISRCYPSLFENDQERKEYAKKLGMKQTQLPGSVGRDFANKSSPKCNPMKQEPST